jgi:hypothetical protein
MAMDGRYAENAGAILGDAKDGRYTGNAGAISGDAKDGRHFGPRLWSCSSGAHRMSDFGTLEQV